MQSKLLAVLALGGEKTGQTKRSSRRGGLQPLGGRTQADGLDFTLDAPWTPRFHLFRPMPDHTFHDRHAGRGETQRFALNQGSGQFDRIFRSIQQSLDNQAAGCSAGLAAASAGADTAASALASIIDLDFSSFIIGDGVVMARLVLMVR